MLFLVIGALLIGLTLGLLGSGGSILTVPVLVYLIGHNAKISIAESMAIVGLIGIASAIPYARKRQIDWKSVLYFGIPGMAGTLIGAWIGGFSDDAIQLSVFGIVLLLAAAFMIRRAFFRDRRLDGTGSTAQNYGRRLTAFETLKMTVEGLAVGVLTGFVGVGGGFLIVPALIVFGKLPVRLAIGTSLIITVLKSFTGFAKYQHYLLEHAMTVDWSTIAAFSLLGIVGGLLGNRLNSRLNQRVLQQVFAVFLVIVGGFILIREGSSALFSRERPEATTAEKTPRSAGGNICPAPTYHLKTGSHFLKIGATEMSNEFRYLPDRKPLELNNNSPKG